MNSRTDSFRVEAPRSRQRDVLPSSLTEARHPKWIRAFCLSTWANLRRPFHFGCALALRLARDCWCRRFGMYVFRKWKARSGTPRLIDARAWTQPK